MPDTGDSWRSATTARIYSMSEAPRDTQDMARAVWNKDLDAIRRILARKPNLSHCLDGYSRSGGDHDFTMLRMLLAAGADINDRSFGEPLLHSLVDIIADSQGSAYGGQPDWGPVGRMIELGADPTLLDDDGRNLLEVAAAWGERASLDAYLRSLKIRLG